MQHLEVIYLPSWCFFLVCGTRFRGSLLFANFSGKVEGFFANVERNAGNVENCGAYVESFA